MARRRGMGRHFHLDQAAHASWRTSMIATDCANCRPKMFCKWAGFAAVSLGALADVLQEC
jgi:hypothetical protein